MDIPSTELEEPELTPPVPPIPIASIDSEELEDIVIGNTDLIPDEATQAPKMFKDKF